MVKFIVIVISELTLVWGMLLRSDIQWFYRDFTRQTVKLLGFKCVLTILSVLVMVNAFDLD